MIRIRYSGAFLRNTKKLDPSLQGDLLEAVEKFKDRPNHRSLRVHKLHGELGGYYSFSINYRFRIVFEWTARDEVLFHAVGDHSIYD